MRLSAPRSILVLAVLFSVVLGGTAFAQVGQPTPTGGTGCVSTSPVGTSPLITSSVLSSSPSFGFFSFMRFASWGTPVARPLYRSPAFVLRERIGLTR
jgi:hypothetical protein